MTGNKFPHDKDNRIQKLYRDVNINIIFNKNKLQSTKKKFIKYVNYLIKYEKNNIQPNISRLQKSCWKYKMLAIQESRKVIDDPTYENSIEINKYITIQINHNDIINNIYFKIKQIKTHLNKVHKHYKKCAYCERMNMVTICGCKTKHNLCSDCIDNINECPVCKENLGLVHCDICIEYKIELVDTGCKNNHQTCKDCLDKIKNTNPSREFYCKVCKTNYIKYKCPFCRDIIEKFCYCPFHQ